MQQDPNDANKYYYNATVTNSSNQIPILAESNLYLSTPIIDNTDEYNVSIMRLFVSGNALPLYSIEVLDPLGPPPYVTKFIACMSYGGVDTRENVVFSAHNNVNVLQSNGDTLFDLYTYQQWLDDINTAYTACYTYLTTVTNLATITTNVPKFIYDPDTKLISFYADPVYESGGVNDIKLYMNKLLFDFFVSFEANYSPTPYQTVGGRDVQLLITKTNAINVSNVITLPPVVSGSTSMWKVTQEYSSVTTWNSVKSLIITADIGTVAESIPNIENGNGDVVRSSLTILTDIDSDFSPSNTSGTRGYIQYLPTAQYRMSSLIMSAPLYRIRVAIQYITFKGVVKNLYLNPYFSMSFKLLFEKKIPLVRVV